MVSGKQIEINWWKVSVNPHKEPQQIFMILQYFTKILDPDLEEK